MKMHFTAKANYGRKTSPGGDAGQQEFGIQFPHLIFNGDYKGPLCLHAILPLILLNPFEA
jgi:hypothetical protein